MNVSLLAKWWWKLEQEEGLWQYIVKFKYMHNKSIFFVSHRATDSPMWCDLLKVRDIYLQGRVVSIKNGVKTRFWCDPWLYDKPLMVIIPTLFLLCDQKEVFVADVKNGNVQITFRRRLTDGLQLSWDGIKVDVERYQLQEIEDQIIWRIGKNKKISMKSFGTKDLVVTNLTELL